MFLTSLTLQNFRSYAKATFTFSPDTTLILGPNASGKTNILEAVTLGTTGKSFRAERDREMIRWGEDVSRVLAEVTNLDNSPSPPLRLRGGRGELATKLELVLTSGEVAGQKAPLKKYLVNGVPRRQIDFVGNLRAVLFWPEDLELVTDSPSLRRRYLDSVLVQVDREYRRDLLSYERGLRQRNRLLDFINEGQAHRRQLIFWDQLLIRTGGYLTGKRGEYLNFVNTCHILPVTYHLVYDKSVISDSRLAQYAEEEVAAKATLVGPHRDDFIIQLRTQSSELRAKEDNYTDLSKFGSRGEQRLAVLWLKLAELSYIEERSREAGSGSAKPVLLLDDIFSELDPPHRQLVLDLIGKQQTIVTSADPHIIDEMNLKEAKIIRL